MKKTLYPHLQPINDDKISIDLDEVTELVKTLEANNKDFEIPFFLTDKTSPKIIRCIVTSIQLLERKAFKEKLLAEHYLCNPELIRSEVTGKLLPFYALLEGQLTKESQTLLEMLLESAIITGMKIQEFNENIENIPTLQRSHKSIEDLHNANNIKKEKTLPIDNLINAIMDDVNKIKNKKIRQVDLESAIFDLLRSYSKSPDARIHNIFNGYTQGYPSRKTIQNKISNKNTTQSRQENMNILELKQYIERLYEPTVIKNILLNNRLT